MKEKNLTRKELYDLVWSKPVSSILKTYFLTDAEFRKVCLDMKVPLPKSGHWQKVKAGKVISAEPLPNEYEGKIEVKFMEKEEGEEDLVALTPLEALQKEIENDPSVTLTVPKKLTNPDKLITIAKDVLTHKDANRSRYYGMVFSSDDSVDIRVSSDNVDRALRFMDIFIKSIRARGHKLVVENKNTYAIVCDEKIQISLREKTRREMVKRGNWERTEYVPTGVLYFQIGKYSYRKVDIVEGKQLIEELLPKILAKLEMEGKKEREDRLRIEKYWEDYREKERIKHEYEELKENELSAFKSLFSKANRWNQAIILREYIDEVEAQTKVKGTVSEELQNWLSWARKKVDWYDPFIEAEDKLLKEIDKDTLTAKE